MDSLLTHLENWQGFTALVVGDLMLDQIVYGDADRLTADAPVPILQVRRSEHRPGGAANLALALAAMKGRVKMFGVTGDDQDARLLRESLEEGGGGAINLDGVLTDPSRPTTVKRSFVGLAQHRHPQKMFRVDHESRQNLDAPIAEALLKAFARSLAAADVVCIEDYAKGVCSEEVCQAVITLAKKAGKPVLVDPAGIDEYARYRGASAITPNRTEAERATGLELAEDGSAAHNAQLAVTLMGELELEAVVLTLDRHGALLLEHDADPIAVPTIAREVYDVTGAGDLVLAGLAAARANGCSWLDSVQFANAAAGLEVEVFGVKAIPLEKIHREVLVRAGKLNGKLRTMAQTLVEVAAVRGEGGKVVFTNGCFDVLHAGHISLLEQAARFGDLLVVGLNADESIQRLKGDGRPVNNEADRAKVLGALESVGAIVLFSEDTPINLIDAIGPDVLVKGADYTKDQVVGGELVESRGGRIELVNLVEGKSTTGMLERMKGG